MAQTDKGIKPDYYVEKIDRLVKANNTVADMHDDGKSAATIAKELGVTESTVKTILSGKTASVSQADVDRIVEHADAVAAKHRTPAQNIAELTKGVKALAEQLK